MPIEEVIYYCAPRVLHRVSHSLHILYQMNLDLKKTSQVFASLLLSSICYSCGGWCFGCYHEYDAMAAPLSPLATKGLVSGDVPITVY
jgi:hypothetical protein